MADRPNWAFTGNNADKALDRELAVQKDRREKAGQIRRIWMPADESKHITFVDGNQHPKGYDLPFRFMEHQIQIAGDWRNWFTCLGKDCPLCEAQNRPYLAEAITVIDHSEYTSKVDKKLHKDEMRLFVAKSTVQKILKKARDKKKSLRGWKVEVSRTKNESPGTGDSFDFEEKVELDPSIQPLDYYALFAPKTREELDSILSGKGPSVDYNSSDEEAVDAADPKVVNTKVTEDEDDPVDF